MDEKHFEEAQALTERMTQFGIEQTLQCHLEPPLVIDHQRYCRDCHDPLSDARLHANPHAVRCVDCQIDHERERRIHG